MGVAKNMEEKDFSNGELREVPKEALKETCPEEMRSSPAGYSGERPGPARTKKTDAYTPKSIDEDLLQREASSRYGTDKVARRILVLCILVMIAGFAMEFAAGWAGISFESQSMNNSLDAIKYIAATILGYLFGKSAIGRGE
jgi:hypothetical protein